MARSVAKSDEDLNPHLRAIEDICIALLLFIAIFLLLWSRQLTLDQKNQNHAGSQDRQRQLMIELRSDDAEALHGWACTITSRSFSSQ